MPAMRPSSPIVTPNPEQSRIQDLVQKQRAFFASGKTLSVGFRIEQLKLLRKALREFEQALLDAMYEDFRKPPFESFATEIGFVEKELQLVIENVARWAKRRKVKETLLNFPGTSYVYSEPFGTTLIIGAWNYPFQLVMNPLIGTIAAGNCAIVKPSELTYKTSAVISQIIANIYDEAYVAVVEGGVGTTQTLLAERFDKLFFTGSTQVGRIVMKAAAEHLTPVTLELGGKSPAIVDEDTDLDMAARRIAWGKYLNAGQTCIAPDYVLVHEHVKEDFIELLHTYVHNFYGKDPAQSPDFARIISDRHFERLISYLQEGHVRVGGQTDASTRYIAPTVLDKISWEHKVMQEEIFGPILPVLPFQDLDEAIRTVNSHERPLALYYFSPDSRKQQEVLTRTHFGGGCLNDTVSHIVNPHLPFGGVGQSGMGSYHGQASFDLFSHQKSILSRGTWLDLPFRYPPYQDRISLIRKLFRWL